VPLTDQDAGMVNRFRESQSEKLSLQPPLQKVFDLESKHIIQFHARFIEHPNSHETTNQSIALEETTRILFLEREKFTRSTTDFGERELDAPVGESKPSFFLTMRGEIGWLPDFAFVAQTVFAQELQLGIQAGGLVRSAARSLSQLYCNYKAGWRN
jgi:hypothetical protein